MPEDPKISVFIKNLKSAGNQCFDLSRVDQVQNLNGRATRSPMRTIPKLDGTNLQFSDQDSTPVPHQYHLQNEQVREFKL